MREQPRGMIKVGLAANSEALQRSPRSGRQREAQGESMSLGSV
jgi:hypothetical protein